MQALSITVSLEWNNHMKSKLFLSFAFLVLTAFAPAQSQPKSGQLSAAGRASALEPARAARIDQLLQRYVDENRIAGAVALVLRDGKPVYERTVGWADKEAGRRMNPSTIFRIASQTKAITSTAVLSLVEAGKIVLNEPVGHFIPTFDKTTVAVKNDSGITIVPARRAITIQDLLTHTAGISYGTERHVASLYEAEGLGPAAGNGWYTADKDEPICTTMERLGSLPFVAQPGEAFVYGYNTDILGCVVEKASGMSLDEFVRTRITEPLGLKDTRFLFRRPHATGLRLFIPAIATVSSFGLQKGQKAKDPMWMGRVRASRVAPASLPRLTTTRVFLK